MQIKHLRGLALATLLAGCAVQSPPAPAPSTEVPAMVAPAAAPVAEDEGPDRSLGACPPSAGEAVYPTAVVFPGKTAFWPNETFTAKVTGGSGTDACPDTRFKYEWRTPSGVVYPSRSLPAVSATIVVPVKLGQYTLSLICHGPKGPKYFTETFTVVAKPSPTPRPAT